MPDAFKYDVFVSYNRQDRDWVRGVLLPRLEGAGLRVCIDFRDFQVGAAVVKEIERAVDTSRKTLLVLTSSYLESEWTEFENVILRTLDPANRQLRMIPVLRAACTLPTSFKAFIYVDLTDDGDSFAWSRVLTSLGATQAPCEPTPATRADWRLVHPYGMPPNFTGRLAERKVLSDWLEQKDGPALLVLRALGGFGKTALVWHWMMHDVDPARWPRVVWWSFYDEPSFDEFLRETLVYLGLGAQGLGAREGVRRLVGVLQRSNVLVVLDGFERALRAFSGMDAGYKGDDEERRLGERDTDCVSIAAEVFIKDVAALPSLAGRMLLTTRLRPRILETRVHELLSGCREVELMELNPADAVEFFRAQRVCGTRAEIESACAQYGFHPLSLRLLAGMIVKDLRQPGDIQVAQRLDVSGDLIQRRHHVLEQSYASLPVKERQLLSRLACFRGAVAYEALVAAAGGLPESEMGAALRDLIERGLIHQGEREARFDLHPIVRRFAYDVLIREEKEEAHRSLRDYFDAVPPPEMVETLADLIPVIELYHHMAKAGEYDAAQFLFYRRLDDETYYHFGSYELRIELLRALFPDGEDQPPRLRKASAQAWILNAFANSYTLSGQPRRARLLFERHNKIRMELGDKSGLARGLGNWAFMTQLPIGALYSGEAALRHCIELNNEIVDEWGLANGQQALGRLLGIRGKWKEARSSLAAALRVFERWRVVRCQGAIWACRALLHLLHLRSGGFLDAQKSRLSALRAARCALEMADNYAHTDYPVERDYVRAHWLLGAAFRESGDFSEAEPRLSEALERCRRINLVDHEADILVDLGRLRRVQGDAAEARRLGEEAVAIAERCEYVLQGADAYLLLALLDKEAGNLGQAREHAERARELAICDGPPDYTYKVAYDEAWALLVELG